MDLFDFDFSNDLDNSSSEPKLIFFDTETTGSSKDDKVIEFGAIVAQEENFEVIEERCGLRDTELINIEAMAVHGIRNEEIEGLEPFESSKSYRSLEELNSANNYLIAHNLPFDLGMLQNHAFESKFKHIDTLQCSRHLFEVGETLGDYEYALPNHKLQTFRYILLSKVDEEQAIEKYGGDIKAHNALGDVIILKLFFEKLMQRAKTKEPSLSESELLEHLVELSKKPVMVKSFSFGKYKGKLLREVLEIDRGYLEWLYKDIKKRQKSGESIDENMFNTLKELVG